MNQDSFDIAIIGGGIVGAATFYQIQKRYPGLKIALLEKESKLAPHQTGHNSGVMHSGLYYKPRSLKATNCVKGREELVAFARENDIPHDVCGKIVVATEESELPYLDKIYETGLKNGLSEIRKINAAEIKEHEPFCEGIAGLWVPYTGIIDYVKATEKMVDIAISMQPDSKLMLNTEALSFQKMGDQTEIRTSQNPVNARHIIFCGGLQADRLARKDHVALAEHVVGFRGDYYELSDSAKHKVRNLIYPVPNPDFPFLGVHFTRMTNGDIECGPNAVFTFKREGYRKTDFNFTDTADALSYKGTWNLFFHNMSFGINEYRRAFSKKLFLKTLQRLIPSLTMNDIHPGRSGVRALLLSENGDTRDDFKIEYKEESIHVLNAPSPAATASLAIGTNICELAEKHFNLANVSA